MNENIKTILQLNIDNPQGREAYKDVTLKKNNSFIAGFIQDDSMFIFGHGTKDGGIIAAEDTGITSKFLTSVLEEESLIPKNIKDIYTMSCYGGLQKPFELSNGVKVQSIHTSEQKIKFGLTQQKDGSVNKLMIGVTDNSSLSNSFKEKFNIENGGSINLDLAFSPNDFNEAVLNSKAKHGALTSKEAFDKYGPNDDKFYTSQGLDPAQQRKSISDITAKTEPDIILEKESSIISEDIIKPELKKKSINPEQVVVKQEPIKTKPDIPKKQLSEVPQKALNENFKFKNIGKAGKVGLVAAIVGGAALYGVSQNNKKKKKEEEQQYDTSYAQQMAADISSYKYGKKMTGFVN